MSLDNGVYILKLQSGNYQDYEYHVTVVHAIENALLDLNNLYDSFEQAMVFPNQDTADQFANILQEAEPTEHGVLYITSFEDHSWTDIKNVAMGIGMNEYELYTKRDCIYCVKAKQVLDIRGLAYVSFEVGTDLTKAELIEQFPHAKTLPIILMGGQVIGGYTELIEHLKQLDENENGVTI